MKCQEQTFWVVAIVGEQLSLNPKMVRNQVSLIFDKLNEADPAGAIIRAREAGIGGA